MLMTQIGTLSGTFTSNMWHPVKLVLRRNNTGVILNPRAQQIEFLSYFASVYFFPFVGYSNKFFVFS